MIDVCIFVKTCSKYEKSRAIPIEETWGSNNFVTFITDCEKSSLKNFIYLDSGNNGHPPISHEDMVYMFSIFLKQRTQNWLMIIDDDSYLYVEKLLTFLTFFDTNDTYIIGDFLSWPKYQNIELDYSWPSGGPGIIFSRKCVEILLEILKRGKIIENHDALICTLFNISDKMAIKRVHCPGFHQYANLNFFGYGDASKELSIDLINEINTKNPNFLISLHLRDKLNSMIYQIHENKLNHDKYSLHM